jgi:hydrogenase nickel incorporation protein HypA/HybF
MHEWALADAVLEAASSALAGRNPACLRSVTVLLGELQAVEREIFDTALATLLEERPFHTAAFVVETVPAGFSCTACGKEWDLSSMPSLDLQVKEAIHFLPEAANAYLRCPACGSPDFRLSRGRGVSLKEIVLSTAGGCA